MPTDPTAPRNLQVWIDGGVVHIGDPSLDPKFVAMTIPIRHVSSLGHRLLMEIGETHPVRVGTASRPTADRLVLLPLNQCAIGPGEQRLVATRTQIPITPLRLIVDPKIAPFFLINDIRIRGSVLAGIPSDGVAVAASCFPATPPLDLPIDNVRGLPTINAGDAFELLVTNNRGETLHFSAVLFGEPA